MKAVLKNGVIYPQEPIPTDWSEGTELEVAKAPAESDADAVDRWYEELDAVCSHMDPDDSATLMKAIQEVRQQEKELARKQAGLDG